MLADTEAKQSRHRKDLNGAIANGKMFNVALLVTMEDYPRLDRWGAFYGQSVSLAEFLVERKTPEQFVNFIERAAEKGYDATLQECYGISNLAELDHQWRRQLYSTVAAL